MCADVESIYLFLAFNIHLTVLLCLCIYIRILFPFVYFIAFFIHSIVTVMSTHVTTPYLYNLCVLYSHSLMKVAVYIVTESLNRVLKDHD